ncbi:MAG: DEAD/DEAH box helicase, partial [Phycisphaerae bacterium]
PDLHHVGGGRYRGYWRVVVEDEASSQRLASLIKAMPPVCRAVPATGPCTQAADVIENFLWATVDGLVRRCMEGDELTLAIRERSVGAAPPAMRWLRSLVDSDPMLPGDAESAADTWRSVRGWVSKLTPPAVKPSCRTCFSLHPPGPDRPPPADDPERTWLLTLHLQAVDDPSLVIDATRLADRPGDAPVILKRPFDDGVEQLREDVARVARQFPPLAACGAPAGPLACSLTTEEAYRFLHDALPLLELEGFGVWVPRWWREEGARLGMRLRVSPGRGSSPTAPGSMGLAAVVSYDWRVALGDDELSREELEALASAKAPLVRLRGVWTEVRPAEVATALRFIERGHTGEMTVMEALRQSYVHDDLETGLPVTGLEADGWVSALLGAPAAVEGIEDVGSPEGFRGELRPYQLRGLNWLVFLSRLGLGACLADDMGLGKTIQMIALWLAERAGGEPVGPTLLVVPMSLVGNWQREITRFGPSLRVMVHHGLERLSGQAFLEEVDRHDVVISTYGLIHRDLEHIAQVRWHRVALDEAQNIKNPAARQSAAVRSLHSLHRVALTGTPVENRLSELWSILEFLNPGYLGSASAFRRRFAVPIERRHDTDRSDRLRRLIRPFVLRRLKNDPAVAVDLPAKLEMKVFCNLTREQATLYEATVGDMLHQIDRAGGIQRRGLILATLVKLKQICNHPMLFHDDGRDMRHRSGKCERIVEMLEEVVAEGDAALVFTQFRKMGALLEPLLRDALGREVLFMHGGTKLSARNRIVERFQDTTEDTPVFLMSLKTGGFGLNLTAANHVFHFDRWWNPAVEQQATDRTHRIGQNRQVQVHKFVCVGTLEERIDALLEQKKQLADRIMGTGEDWLTEMTTDALRDLFALSRDAVAED